MLQRITKVALLCLALPLAGCATLFNPAGIKTIPDPPPGSSGRVQRFAVSQMPRNAKLWVNDQPVDLSRVDRGTGFFDENTYDFTILIPQDQPVTLRFQDGSQVAEARVQSKFHARWIYFNALLGPVMPIGFYVDSRTKKWTYVRNNEILAKALLDSARSRGAR